MIVTVPNGHIMALKPIRLQELCSYVIVYMFTEKTKYSVVNSGIVYLGCWSPGHKYIYVPPYASLRVVVRHDRYAAPPSPAPPFSMEIHLLDVDFTTPLNGKL